MENHIMRIISDLKSGKTSPNKAIKLIKKYNFNNLESSKKASKLKIKIKDSDSNKKINLPGIPFWLITSLGSLGLTITKFTINKSDTLDDETKHYLKVLDELNLKELLGQLKNYGTFDLVDILEEDGDEVKISII